MRISYKNAKTDLYKINNVLFKFKGSNFYKCKINRLWIKSMILFYPKPINCLKL